MRQPFETSPGEIALHLEELVDAVCSDLQSSFMVLPKGNAFIDYPRFEKAYEELKRSTHAFTRVTRETVLAAIAQDSLVFVVVRAILGMSPPEWAYLATTECGTEVPQNAARSLDQRARTDHSYFARALTSGNGLTAARLRALVDTACRYLAAGPSDVGDRFIHRLDKADTIDGTESLSKAAHLNVPFAMLLYERFLGRPFASHRDAVSELVGEEMENAIESRLVKAHISYRRTQRAERVHGFDQAPDFIIPDEFSPLVVIEAKLTNDDGTARDKFTRMIHLAEISRQWKDQGRQSFEVVACIDGRGFGIRREDMRRLITALEGKVFTLRTLDQMIAHTVLARFATV
jgi:hypothetical protein